MDNYEIHPIANIFPYMLPSEFKALKEDIKANGLKEPIWLYRNKIIDGRNRYKACQELGLTPVIKEYSGTESELLSFVLSLNLHRRHLSTSQRACLGYEYLLLIEEENKKLYSEKMSKIKKGGTSVGAEDKIDTSKQAGEIFSVSDRYVREAKNLFNANQDLFQEVKTGLKSLQQAKKELSEKKDVSEIFPKGESPVLSKGEIKKVDELVNLGVNKEKATTHILSKRKITVSSPRPKLKKEVKFLVDESDKLMLENRAKEQKISVSELLRKLIHVAESA